jgi:DNA-binding transcriptional LysR family regulator
VQEGAEITFRVGTLEDSGLIARRVGAQRYVICASRTYLDTRGTPRTPEDLAAHNCLVYRGHRGAQRWYFREPSGGTYEAFDVSGTFESNNAEALVSAAHAGLGLVLFPTWLFAPADFQRGRLVKLFPEWEASVEAEPPEIHLVSPENRSRSRKVRVVADYLLERIGHPPYWDAL